MGASAFSGTAALYGGRLASALAQALALLGLAREVEPIVLGTVSVAVALAGFTGIVADLGLESAALRARARGEIRESLSIGRLHRVAMLTVATLVAASVLASRLVRPESLPIEFFLLAAWVYLERRNSLGISMAVAQSEELRAGLCLGASRLLALIAYISLPSTLGSPEFRYLLFLIASAAVSQLMLATGPRTMAPAREPKTLAPSAVVRAARPYWIATLSGQARTMDTVVVGAVAGPAVAGLYALPARAVGPLRLAATSISFVAMPRAAKADWSQIRSLERSMWRVLAVFAVGVVAVWMWGDLLLRELLGDSYGGTAAIVAVLMVGVLFNIPGALWSGVLQGSSKQHSVAKVGLWLVPAFFLFIIVGSSVNGAEGAAWGVTATFILQFSIMLGYRLSGHWGGRE